MQWRDEVRDQAVFVFLMVTYVAGIIGIISLLWTVWDVLETLRRFSI